MMTIPEVIKFLNQFPDSKAIAEHLREHAFTGIPRESDHCPIANYVSARTGETIYVAMCVDRCEAIVLASGSFGRGRERYQLGKHVNEFIKEFDSGIYPYLIEWVIKVGE